MEDNTQNNQALLDELYTGLAENFNQVLQVLSVIVGIQDRFHDGSHSRFVSQKSAELAQMLDMEEEDVLLIKMAGLLHDIGKIGLKENIIMKFQNEMNSIEFESYARHTEAGREILRRYKDFIPISELVFQHHERLNGSGFPLKLTGKDILPGASIISIVDTYHNSLCKLRKDKNERFSTSLDLVNTASYLEQSQSRHQSAMNLLISKSGVWFDKKSVEAFQSLVDEDRKAIGLKNIMRISVTRIEEGMVFAEDYYTKYGLLIAAKDEPVSKNDIKALKRFAEFGHLPERILVIFND